MTTEEAEIPTITQYTHSVKITDTAKGIRIDVHVYANNQMDAIGEAIGTYLNAKKQAKFNDIQLAPIELKVKEITE